MAGGGQYVRFGHQHSPKQPFEFLYAYFRQRLLATQCAIRARIPIARRRYSCIQLARDKGHSHVVLHTTHAMQVAWSLYEKLGFERSKDLDFVQEGLQVFGFRLWLGET